MDRFTVDFQKFLHKEVSGLKRVSSTEQCDFILDFCLITSRAGTDIDAAIKNLNHIRAFKPVILGVLFPTIDPEKIISDSNSAKKKENLYLVDFLFNEDKGFMKCQRNYDAIKKLANYIKCKNLKSYCLQNYGNRHQLYPRHGNEDRDDLQENAICVGVVGLCVVIIITIIVVTVFSTTA